MFAIGSVAVFITITDPILLIVVMKAVFVPCLVAVSADKLFLPFASLVLEEDVMGFVNIGSRPFTCPVICITIQSDADNLVEMIIPVWCSTAGTLDGVLYPLRVVVKYTATFIYLVDALSAYKPRVAGVADNLVAVRLLIHKLVRQANVALSLFGHL